MAELKLVLTDCNCIIHLNQSIVNEATKNRLKKHADDSTGTSLQIMSGIRPRHSLLEAAMGHDTLLTERNAADHISKFDKFHSGLASIHKKVHERRLDRREKATNAHNTASNIVIPRLFFGTRY